MNVQPIGRIQTPQQPLTQEHLAAGERAYTGASERCQSLFDRFVMVFDQPHDKTTGAHRKGAV
ncbi:MAG: hypothetical protein DI601_22070 [Azospirillum brasilense]|nr:MAG: hypothetical protein DI601_22070 [Azospirillum brasilense]